MINPKHPVTRLMGLTNGSEIERTFVVSFISGRSKLLEKSRLHMFTVARKHRIASHCARSTTAHLATCSSYRAHPTPSSLGMKKALRTLRTCVERVQRELARLVEGLPEQDKTTFDDLLTRAGRILASGCLVRSGGSLVPWRR